MASLKARKNNTPHRLDYRMILTRLLINLAVLAIIALSAFFIWLLCNSISLSVSIIIRYFTLVFKSFIISNQVFFSGFLNLGVCVCVSICV